MGPVRTKNDRRELREKKKTRTLIVQDYSHRKAISATGAMKSSMLHVDFCFFKDSFQLQRDIVKVMVLPTSLWV